jgi:hypothetical protein
VTPCNHGGVMLLLGHVRGWVRVMLLGHAPSGVMLLGHALGSCSLWGHALGVNSRGHGQGHLLHTLNMPFMVYPSFSHIDHYITLQGTCTYRAHPPTKTDSSQEFFKSPDPPVSDALACFTQPYGDSFLPEATRSPSSCAPTTPQLCSFDSLTPDSHFFAHEKRTRTRTRVTLSINLLSPKILHLQTSHFT